MNFDTERMLDANFNRLSEGLRVLEDCHRFVLKDEDISSTIKHLRHQASELFVSLNLIQSRQTESDHGRFVSGAQEYQRNSLEDLLKSNFKRVEQSLRVLEELSKLDSEARAKALEAMRYKVYELEQRSLCRKVFPSKCLYVLITKSLCKLDPAVVVKAVCDGGASVIQLREKSMEDGEFLKWIEFVQKITEQYEIPLIINDRIHLVQLTGVQGVHMGQGDLPTQRAKSLLKPWQWLGRSTHEMVQAKAAESEGVDYIGVGPLFPTNTKEHREAVGMEYLKQVDREISIPYVGIGSVNHDTMPKILEYNPKGLAICTAIIATENPQEVTQLFVKQIVN